MKVNVIDLDNCIADDRWRRTRLEGKTFSNSQDYYKSYHEGMEFDDFLNGKICTGRIVVITGRPEKYKEQTKFWLRKNGIHHDALYMRSNDDNRASPDIKRDAFLSMIFDLDIEDVSNVTCYDDRDDVLEMYMKSFGVKAVKMSIDGGNGIGH
jgi:hypothetical protein